MAKIAVIDSETDPFDGHTIVQPFVWGFYDGETKLTFWGADCTEQLVAYLETIDEPLLIYAHNAGKFDFFFMLKYIERDIRIVNGRILQCWIGKHEMRDSYAIIPVALRTYQKDDIDYNKMHKSRRNKNRAEIISYLGGDLVYLHELVMGFNAEFGDRLTIGGTAMSMLKEFHKFDQGNKNFDAKLRQFYFGGRNQLFKSGVIHGRYKIFDVNSMYPAVMKSARHPVSVRHEINKHLTSKTCFACIEAKNYGALPVRTKTGIDFTCEEGVFFASIHEIEAGEDTGTLEIKRIKWTMEFAETATFENFVDHYYNKRLEVQAAGDKMRTIFYKLILNSAYGKFAQNPENYQDHCLTRDDELLDDPWTLAEQNGEFTIWAKPSNIKTYYNIATAASITAAARAQLLRGLADAVDPVYCDTDSIICREFKGEINAKKLGAWKLEGEGDSLAIAGKKLYAVFDDIECIKKAHKGSILTAQEIKRIAEGAQVTFTNPAPHFNFDGSADFIRRTIKTTANAKAWKERRQRRLKFPRRDRKPLETDKPQE